MSPKKDANTRMRLVGWNIQPVIMSDDGENLTPVPVQATMIPAAGWQEFKDGGDKSALEDLRAQIENGKVDTPSI
jgi:hypothetical protein